MTKKKSNYIFVAPHARRVFMLSLHLQPSTKIDILVSDEIEFNFLECDVPSSMPNQPWTTRSVPHWKYAQAESPKTHTHTAKSTPHLKHTNQNHTYLLRPILMLQSQRQILARRKRLQPKNINLITRSNLIIILRINKRQRQHPLFLQIRFMDTSKRSSDNRQSTEESRFKCSVFTRWTFTVVVVSDDNPFDTLVTVLSSDLRNSTVFTGVLILDLVDLAVLSVDSTNETIFYASTKM